MRLPRFVLLLGYAGLIPFLAGPLWLTLAPQGAPEWLDHLWSAYIELIAAFLAGTFWGFALMAAAGPEGRLGIFIASALMLLTWIAMWLPFRLSLYGLALVFLLLLLADFWRERTLDTIPGYFKLRTTLTVGVLIAIAWRLLLIGSATV
jgi:hypothetical protein